MWRDAIIQGESEAGGGRAGQSPAMKRRLTVHVGLAKAGSTSIQHLLAARWRALSRFGIHVPGIGSSARLSGHNQLPQANTMGDRHGAWAQLAKEIRNADAERFVISSEAFASPNNREPCVARLLKLAERENLEIEVIAYVRPQWQLLESAYAQRVKVCDTAQRFEDFTTDVLRVNSRPWAVRLDYNRRFAPFRAAFGDRVRVFALERSRLPQGLLVHFLEVLGVHDGLNVAELARANARHGAKALEARRVVRQRVGSRYLSDGVLLSRRIAWLPSLFVDDAPFAGFGLEEIRRIDALFGATNARFARDYGIDRAGVLFRDPVDQRRRRNVACWQTLPREERLLARRYVLDRTGIDLDPDLRGANTRWRVRMRMVARSSRRAAALPGQWRQFVGYPNVLMAAYWLRRRMLGLDE